MSRLCDSIAIVGMGCRYPDARGTRELWENVLSQRRAFRRIPAERLRLEDYFSENGAVPDSIYSTSAALLEDYRFDRLRFRIGERAYRSADLAHWLALDVASRALEDAGFPDGEGLDGEGVGVLVGNTLTGEFSRACSLRLRWPYMRRQVASALSEEGWGRERREAFLERLEKAYKEPFPETTEESLAGGLSNTIAGRICNHFDFHGGGYTVDGACASSLLAVANACSALAAGDLDVALAGGVDLSLDPFELVGFARTQALAAGEMRVYDRRSAGFIPGEGCGFVVLMPHRAALDRGFKVYAVLRGWGISSDGGGGLTRPEVGGQLLALRRAYRRAGFGIDSVGLLEGHGTGTAVGDATELAALNRARREAGAADRVPIGSIKANIGHTKAAAGVASLIKATLALHHRVLPPATGCEDLHPEIGGAESTLRVLRRPGLWPGGVPLRAGVSAMGFGGINSHLVLEGLGGSAPRRSFTAAEQRLLPAPQDAEVFFLAGRDEATLAARVDRLARLAEKLSRSELTDLAAALAGSIEPGLALRAAVVAATPGELRARLDRLREGLAVQLEQPWLDFEGGVFAGRALRPPRIGLLFPGQGSPCHLDGGIWRRRFDAVEKLYREARLPGDDAGCETAVAQPAIATAALAGLAVLGRLGIEATVAAGHSLGELVALHWAGAWDERALLRLASARGKGMSELSQPRRSTMASLGAGPGEAERLLADLDTESLLITGYNSATQTVISGSVEDVEAAISRARSRGWKAHRLDVSHAFHSPFVAAAVPRLREALEAESTGPLLQPVVSSVTGERLTSDADLKSLLCRQITSPVRFSDAFAAVDPDVDVFLEVGPGEVLSGLVRPQTMGPVIALDAGGESLRGLLRAVGALYVLGTPLDPQALFSDRFSRPFDPDRDLRFLVNPCELAPVEGVAPPAAQEAETEPEASAETDSPPLPAVSGSSPLELVRELIARRAELSFEAITDDSRLLSDLHLNSITVGELVTEAARRLDQPPPFAPTEYADATVLEIAQALEEMGAGSSDRAGSRPAGTREPLPAGVDVWTRAFTVDWAERPLPRPVEVDLQDRPWRVLTPPGHPLRSALEKTFRTGGGTVLCLPPGIGDLDLMLETGRTALAERDGPLVLIQPGAAAAPFFRTLYLEAPEIPVAVVDIPAEGDSEPEVWCRHAWAEARAVRRFSEARYDGEGRRYQPVLRPLSDAAAASDVARSEGEAGNPASGDGDVLLVSGGGKGIAAECALALARSTGAKLALLGRSRPRDDEELRANLERLASHGVRFLYLSADVTDRAAVGAAVARVGRDLGEVRGILHGAGANTPRLIGALERADFESTLAPKAAGLENLLDAVDRRRLKLLVGFGSIIGRAGLRGEADYAVANDQLRRRIERFAAEHPACRSLCVEWSVWSGVGMGARLGRLEALTAQGITPISPDDGIEILRELVTGPRPPVSVVVTGRFGDPPTLEVERPELPLRRFLEKPRVYFPGVELVVDCDLSKDTDPYVEEHVFDGQRLFPAVMGLEAMAQVSAALTGRFGPPAFHDVRFERPISVVEAGSTTVRLAALVRRSGDVEVALRSSGTAFQVDHFRARCRFSGEIPDGAELPEGRVRASAAQEHVPLMPLSPSTELYGSVLFQEGRFQRLTGYRELSATHCQAEVSPRRELDWFSPYLPAELQLGDPGARDAFIHCIQPCIPHATVLPVAVERLTAGVVADGGPYLVMARERARHGRTLIYDLEVRATDGRLVESWYGLELRIVDTATAAPDLALPLLGPYLERRLQDLVPGAQLSVAVERNGHSVSSGSEVVAHHRPDGKPERADGRETSVSHAGDLVLEVVGLGKVGCDLEPVEPRPLELWSDLLGSRHELVEHLLHECGGEDRDAASTRVWSVLESLRKAGRFPDAPLTFADATEDGWVLFNSGRHTAASVLLAPAGSECRLSFALLAENERSAANGE